MSDLPFLSERDGATLLAVTLAPRASRTAVLGLHDGRLKIAVTAPPVDGRANKLLVGFLAELFRLPKRAVVIERGETSREKLVRIEAAGEKIAGVLGELIGR